MAGIRYRIGIDIGGTFTDLVFRGNDGAIHTKKVSTTPDDYGSGIVAGIAGALDEIGAAPKSVESVVHATTVATNAILEGRGARTALITTDGFRDVLEMRRLRIPEMYTLNFKRPEPLVPRNLRFEIAERIGPTGEIWRVLDEASLAAVVARVAAAEVQSVAICLLHSYANPAHELRVAEAVRAALPEVFVTWSSDILPEIREYERTSTTVINAYLGPILERYFASLQRNLARIGVAAPIHVMKSDGGIMTIAAAMRKPAYIVESGPSAGVIGAAHLARRASLPDTITLDMGGTTAKAAMVERGEVAKTSDYEVGAGINLSSRLVMGGGHALKLPVIDISEIGAGGGSIVALDRGALRVGPKSAGAQPGPVAYGKGGSEPTLTDAMIVLGYINGAHLVGGELRLDRGKAAASLQDRIAAPIGKDLLEVCYGIYAVAAGTMVRAVKAVSTYRGRDPRDFALFAFGGNGPVVASEIAGLLEMTRIVVPLDPGVFSAVGLLHADIAHERTQGLMKRLDATTPAALDAAYAALERDMRLLMAEEGCDPAAVAIRRLADLRYDGQAHELTIALPGGACDIAALTEDFGREHERTYGHQNPANPVECVNLRIIGSVVSAAPPADDVAAMLTRRPRIVPEGTRRDAYFGPAAGLVATPVIERGDLLGHPRSGPLIVEEYDATTIVPPGWHAALDGSGNIVLTTGETA